MRDISHNNDVITVGKPRPSITVTFCQLISSAHYGPVTVISIFRHLNEATGSPIKQSHASYNASVPCPTMYHFGIEICTFLAKCGALCDMGKCMVGFVRLVFCHGKNPLEPLQWCHIHGRQRVSNHRQIDCLFNSLFRLRTTEVSELFITGPLFVRRIYRSPVVPLTKGQ